MYDLVCYVPCSARAVDGNYVAKLKGNQFVGTIYGEAN